MTLLSPRAAVQPPDLSQADHPRSRQSKTEQTSPPKPAHLQFLAQPKRPIPAKAAPPPVRLAFTAEQWAQCIGAIANGVPVLEAVSKASIDHTVLEGFLRTDPRVRAQWDEAKLTALRRHWPMSMIEEICEEIAQGDKLKEIIEHRRERKVAAFMRLVLKDPVIHEMYTEATEIRAELFSDEIVGIADCDENDLNFNGTGNMAAVHRSRLRIDARRSMMAAHRSRVYGEKAKAEVNVSVTINHAERLEEARRRKEKGVVIDMTAVPVDKDGKPEFGTFERFDDIPDSIKQAMGVDPKSGLPVEELSWLDD